MILSMATIILVPTGAEEIDYDTLPLASTALRGDKVDAYKIDSVAELLNTGKVLRLRGYGATATSGGKESGLSGDANYSIWNFEPTDVIYLTADLDITDWDYTSVATYDEATGLYTPNWYANMDSTGNDRGCVTFVDNDGSVTASSLQELFSLMYAGWSWGWSALRGYNVFCFTFDGLGHTISNYYDTHPFFRGMFMGILKNLTFDNAYVDAQPLKDYGYYMSSVIAGGVNVPATIGWTLNGYASTMDNVHVVNSTVKSYPGAKAVGILYSESNKGAGNVNIKNSSIINCTIDCAQAYADNAGVGLVCGYLNTQVDIQNSLFLNNTIDHVNDLRYKNGLILGNTARNGNLDYGFENVAVVGNKIIAPNAATNASIIHASNDYAKETTVNNLYLADNLYAVAADGAEAPMEVVFNYHGEAKNYIDPVFTNVFADSGVTTLMQNDAGTSVSADPAVADDTINAGSVAGRLNTTLPTGSMYWALRKDGSPTTTATAEGLPHNITFIVDANDQFTLQTDYEQALITDQETLVFLSMNEWDAAEGKNAQPGTDWVTKQNPADNTYTLVPHDVTYTPNENGTHTAYCNTCEDEIHNGTHSCVDTAPTGVFVDGGYYNKAVWEYTCLACGNVLTEVDDAATDLLPAPYAVEFEKDLYSNIDETVGVTFTAPADANLVAFTAIVTFDPKVLTYKDCAPADPAYACIVNAAEAATGKLVVSVPSLDGTVLTDAEAVLNFAFNPYGDGETPVDAINVQTELISALVYSDEEGTQERIADVVKTTSEDVAAVIFVEPNVLPGDVDNNGVVEVLDAVILLEKISGQIHASQDGDFFFIMATDVNNDGYTDRDDVDLILDYVADGYTELVACEEIPVIVLD